MFADDLSYFCTITISTITTIITFSTFIHVKYLYISLNKKVYVDKESQTEVDNVDNETQTDEDSEMNSSSFIKIEYVNNPETDYSLENLIILAKNQMIIQQNPSQFEWFTCK